MNARLFAMPRRGIHLATVTAMGLDICLGRALAFALHPSAAWKRLGPRGRALLLGGYAAASYSVVLATLFLL